MNPNGSYTFTLSLYLPVGRILLKADTSNKTVEFRYSLEHDLDVKTKKSVKLYKVSIEMDTQDTYVMFLKNFIALG